MWRMRRLLRGVCGGLGGTCGRFVLGRSMERERGRIFHALKGDDLCVRWMIFLCNESEIGSETVLDS